jgi:outer membrane biosynthesis protein TonB
VPEPTPDPVPDPVPEPIPEPSPDPTPDPAPPQPDLPDQPDVEPPAPEPDVTPPAADSGAASTEDLIARLRGAEDGSPANGSPAAPDVSGSDQAAARLVAMNMALDGSSREEIEAKLRADFGDGIDHDAVLDDVLARAAG